MQTMHSPNVISITDRRRIARAIDARRAIEMPTRRRGGRAWVNGVELGGQREALAHLYSTHD